ncbi:MAG: DNA polymerase, partial [Verrucomicrobiota bacterium]
MLRTLFIDLNGFFASCEQQERPELRGRAVAVAPLAAESTCCIAASAEAKRHGIKTGTRVADARKLCPGLVVLAARPEIYIRYHNLLKAAVESCLPLGEVASIDELWCELPAGHAAPEPARALARKVKAALRRKAGECITCSIGLAPNPWLAKIASDLEKPDGLVVIEQPELPQRLHALALRDLPGVGRNMETRLRAAGITTVAALTAATKEKLRHVWGGIEGERMWRRLRGELVPLPPTRQSTIGHSHVLPPALRNVEGARATLHRLLQKAAMRLRDANCHAGGLHLALRLGRNRSRWSDALTFNDTHDTRELIRVLNLLWDRRPGADTAPRFTGELSFEPPPVSARADTRPYSVGVTLFNLVPAADHIPALPGLLDGAERRQKLNTAIDALNQRLGKNTVVYGGALGALDYAPLRIA